MQRQRHSLRLSNANKSKTPDDSLQGILRHSKPVMYYLFIILMFLFVLFKKFTGFKQPQETASQGKKTLKKYFWYMNC